MFSKLSLLLAALIGGCTDSNGGGNSGRGGDGTTDDTTDDHAKFGYVAAQVDVLGVSESCRANILSGSEVIATDYTDDGEATEIAVGTYEVMAGVSLDTLFSNSDDLAKIESMVDGWNLHPDEKGDLWIGPVQPVTIVVGETTQVALSLNLVPTFGSWTCEGDGGLGGYNEDGFEIEDGQILKDLPGLPEMSMNGNELYHESLEGAWMAEGYFINSSLIQIFDTYDGHESEIWCWAGNEGDDPR